MVEAAPPLPEEPPSGTVRERILDAAADLLAAGGRDALTTRAVAAAAGVQAPTLYRLFGDKRGLLDEVAERGLVAWVAGKTAVAPDPDPLVAYRAGWDQAVAFGLAHPALFAIISGDPQPGRVSPAAEAGQAALRGKVRALASAGLLRVGEARAVELTHAACVGAVLTLLDAPEAARDSGLANAAREAVIAAITRAAPVTERPDAAGAAIALRARLDQTATLSPGERHLLGELLDRIAGEPAAS